MSDRSTREPLELQVFDLARQHLQETGDWPAPGDSCEVLIAVLGPAVRNFCCAVQELQD